MIEHKNTILAIVLSLIVVVGWQYFIGYPQMEKQRHDALLTAATGAGPGPAGRSEAGQHGDAGAARRRPCNTRRGRNFTSRTNELARGVDRGLAACRHLYAAA